MQDVNNTGIDWKGLSWGVIYFLYIFRKSKVALKTAYWGEKNYNRIKGASKWGRGCCS
jgi:hypothetical protein